MRGTLVLVLALHVTSLSDGARAQIGAKVLRDGNIKAAEKLTRAAVLTDSQMQNLSLQSIQWMDSQTPVAEDGEAYAERLKGLVEGLDNEDGLRLNFKVYMVSDVNAFATPDGSVRVMAGLMKLMSDDELRSIIGHEIGHVKLKHSKKQYQKAYAVSASRDTAGANTGSASVLAEGQLGQFVEDVLNAKFSRNDESEADEYGFRFLLKHGYDYHAMKFAFLKLAASSGIESRPSLMDSHPDSATRAERAARWADEEDAKRPITQEEPPPAEEPAEAPAEEPADSTTEGTDPQ